MRQELERPTAVASSAGASLCRHDNVAASRWSLLGGLAAVFVIGRVGRELYVRTIGRRRDRRARLARLGTGAHLSFFVSVLGEPPAMRRTIQKHDSKRIVTPADPDFDAKLAGAWHPIL